MKISALLLSLTLFCSGLQSQERLENENCSSKIRFVVVGDSLSAGVQNFSLLDKQQPHGYASVIARQADWRLTLPLVPFPGAPNVLQLVSLGPPIVIEPVPAKLLAPRVNPDVQPTNIAVPGLTASTALTLRPSLTATDPVQQWATIVLGFPSLLRGEAPTEVELANTLKPDVLIEWLGNNDALVPALTGQLGALTPVDQFAASYGQVLDSLSAPGRKLVTATIPDVTEIPYFTSAQAIADGAGIPLGTVTEVLGIGPNDYVRPSALTIIDQIFTGIKSGPLPASCPPPLPDLGVTALPCVLTAADATTVQAAVNSYNLVITAQTLAHGGAVVDIHGLVDRIHSHGYRVHTYTLTTGFLGGLFSLDGVHPTNTGYAIIANEFILTMNRYLGTRIHQANIDPIFDSDPLAKYVRSPPAGSK